MFNVSGWTYFVANINQRTLAANFFKFTMIIKFRRNRDNIDWHRLNVQIPDGFEDDGVLRMVEVFFAEIDVRDFIKALVVNEEAS